MPYNINGEQYNFPEPKLQENTTFVPLANIVDVMGGYVEWDNLGKVATVELNQRRFRVQADNAKVESDGYYAELQAAPFLEDGTLWVPARFFSNILGGTTTVDGQSVNIQSEG